MNDTYRAANADAFKLHAIFIPGVTLIGNLVTVIILVVGGDRVADGHLGLGILTAFLLYLTQFFGPMQDVAMFLNSMQSATAALEKIALVLNEEPSVPEPTDPVALPRPGLGAVDLDQVEFGYVTEAEGGHPVLHELDLHIPAGQTVALVGATGAGKSTIAKLIARFYDPSTGAVRLDGVDLRDVTEAELRSAVVMVTQDGFLFSGSVADNIAFGRPGRQPGRGRRRGSGVGADPFIRALPEGYDTDVRKRGGRLSAGQRQLVAFARAFLADPAVLILDEATSSLDVPTERTVQRALRTVLRDRTALIIAHRLSTVEIADRVLVLSAGPHRRGRHARGPHRRGRRRVRLPARLVERLPGLTAGFWWRSTHKMVRIHHKPRGSEQVGVLRVLAHVVGDEGAGGYHLQAPSADVVQREADHPPAQTLTAMGRVDVGVGDDDPIAVALVVGPADGLTVEAHFVTVVVGVVGELEGWAHTNANDVLGSAIPRPHPDLFDLRGLLGRRRSSNLGRNRGVRR